MTTVQVIRPAEMANWAQTSTRLNRAVPAMETLRRIALRGAQPGKDEGRIPAGPQADEQQQRPQRGEHARLGQTEGKLLGKGGVEGGQQQRRQHAPGPQAEDGEHRGLADELADQLVPSGAHRLADAHLGGAQRGPADGQVDEVDAPHQQHRQGDAAEHVGDVRVPRFHDAVPGPSQQARVRAQVGEGLQMEDGEVLGHPPFSGREQVPRHLREGGRHVGGIGAGGQKCVGIAGAFPRVRGVVEEELGVVEGQQHVEADRRGARDWRRHPGDDEVFHICRGHRGDGQALPQRIGVAEEALSHLVTEDDGVALG